MSKRIRLLPGMKYMSGGVLYRSGDTLPDTEETRAMVKRKEAEYLDDEPEKSTDDYESMNVKSLQELAQARGIDIPKGTNKAGIVELLKNADEGVS